MSRASVVILSPGDDIHSLAVKAAILRRYPGTKVHVLDMRAFPSRMTLSIRDGAWRLDTEEGVVESATVSALWHRRAQSPVVDVAILDAAAHHFAKRECAQALDFMSMSLEYPVVNPLGNQFLANRKPYQLAVARSCGLAVPDYNVTNDPAAVAETLDAYGEDSYIFKTLTAPVHTFGETRFLKNEYRAMADSLRHAPVILQRAVKRQRELRVTVIGDRMFAQEMVIRNEWARSVPDWRVDITTEAQAVSLDAELTRKIGLLMKTMGLCYGALDFIESNDGETYFLEVNPQGQFLFGEVDTEAPMSLAFAELLVEPYDHGAIRPLQRGR